MPYSVKFTYLLEKLSKIRPVVVLVDEYDRVLTENLDNPELDLLRRVQRGGNEQKEKF